MPPRVPARRHRSGQAELREPVPQLAPNGLSCGVKQRRQQIGPPGDLTRDVQKRADTVAEMVRTRARVPANRIERDRLGGHRQESPCRFLTNQGQEQHRQDHREHDDPQHHPKGVTAGSVRLEPRPRRAAGAGGR